MNWWSNINLKIDHPYVTYIGEFTTLCTVVIGAITKSHIAFTLASIASLFTILHGFQSYINKRADKKIKDADMKIRDLDIKIREQQLKNEINKNNGTRN